MSWWTNARDKYEMFQTGGLYDPAHARHEESAEKGFREEQNRAVNEQIKAYKEQSALTRSELERARGEKAAEKRKVDEKQVRALRHHFRPSGFLNNKKDEQPVGGVAQNLGG